MIVCAAEGGSVACFCVQGVKILQSSGNREGMFRECVSEWCLQQILSRSVPCATDIVGQARARVLARMSESACDTKHHLRTPSASRSSSTYVGRCTTLLITKCDECVNERRQMIEGTHEAYPARQNRFRESRRLARFSDGRVKTVKRAK